MLGGSFSACKPSVFLLHTDVLPLQRRNLYMNIVIVFRHGLSAVYI